MKQRFILIVLVGLVFPSLGAQDVQPIALANGMVEKEDFGGAIKEYQKIIDSGDISSEAYYNLANTYLKIDSVASSILYYEKALRISPDDEDCIVNLEIARGRVVEQVTVLPEFFLITFWKQFYSIMTANLWAVLSIVMMLCLTLIYYFVTYKRVRIRRRKLVFLASVLFFLLILSLCAGYTRKLHETSQNEGIVFQEVFLKSGPDGRSDDLKLLRPGFKIFILDSLNGWNKIRTEDREIGWVQPEVYKII